MCNILDDWTAIFFNCSVALAATVETVLNKLDLVCENEEMN